MINEDTSPGPVQTYPRDCGDAPGRNYKTQLVVTIAPYIYIYYFILIQVTNLICMLQDSVPAGSYNDPFLSSVWHVCIDVKLHTSSTAQGGGGSFKNRKPIGEVGCCESGMAERSH